MKPCGVHEDAHPTSSDSCRICLQNDFQWNSWEEESGATKSSSPVEPEDSQLLSPCACRGSMAFVHMGCLKRWHELKHDGPGSAKCNMCSQPYHGRAAVVLCTLAINHLYSKNAQRTSQGLRQMMLLRKSLAVGFIETGRLTDGMELILELLRNINNPIACRVWPVTSTPTLLEHIAHLQFHYAGDNDQALNFMERAIHLRRRQNSAGENNLRLVNLYYNVGLVLLDRQEGKRAQRSLVEAMTLLKKVPKGKECPPFVVNLVSSALDVAAGYESDEEHTRFGKATFSSFWARIMNCAEPLCRR